MKKVRIQHEKGYDWYKYENEFLDHLIKFIGDYLYGNNENEITSEELIHFFNHTNYTEEQINDKTYYFCYVDIDVLIGFLNRKSIDYVIKIVEEK